MERTVFELKTNYINKTENYSCGEDSIDIKDSIIHNLAELYQYGLKEFGRCVSKVYIDKKDNSRQHIGYVFEKKVKYTDTKEYYTQEAWLTIEHYRETKTREYLPIE